MEQVEGGNVEGRGDSDPSPEIPESGRELEAGFTEVERAVHVRAGDTDHALGAGRRGKPHEQSHRHGRCAPALAVEQSSVLGAQSRALHQMTAVSGTTEPVSNRPMSNGDRSKVGCDPSTNSARCSPTTGPCWNPCPLNPVA